MRKIIHVDMDAFYASIEQRDFPVYAGKPLAVGGAQRRGVIAAASYEARVFGVRSAMPTVVARRLCPDLIVVKPRFEVYGEVSRQIREIFLSYTDLVEPLSLDEAYLDVTTARKGPPSATLIARAIKKEIRSATGLTASAGVSFNKFLAKIASDLQKPDGLSVIRPEEAEAFVRSLPIERFFGIGAVTAGKMRAMGIETGADLAMQSEKDLVARFGKVGHYYFKIARAQDDRPVRPDRERKSVGAERTFQRDLTDEAEMQERLVPIAENVAARLHRISATGKTVTLKIKFNDFSVTTRSRTFSHDLSSADDLIAISRELLHTPTFPGRPVRLLGISVSNLSRPTSENAARQLTLDL